MSVHFRARHEGDRGVADVGAPQQAADELAAPVPHRKGVTSLAHLMSVAVKAPPLAPPATITMWSSIFSPEAAAT